MRRAADILDEAGMPPLDSRGAGDPLPDEPMTELGYARRLVHARGEHLRYVPPWKRWLVWDGCRWDRDHTGQAARWAKQIARDITTDALSLGDKKARTDAYAIARRAETSSFISGVLKLAATEDTIAVLPGELDADPHLLNVANGVLDLRTGQLGPHDPELLLTKMAGAAFDPAATRPAFDGFLSRVQPSEAMRAFLARLLGHALEGRVVSHVLPIFYGAGANGKSTLTAAVMAALGDYAAPADPELLTAKSFDAHPTGTADLCGLRLALLHESDSGRRLAEGTVKRLTGGDAIKARRMREDFWSFTPSHTFVLLTNHRPVVGGTDDGIWRRIRLVPWPVIIPLAERDEELGDRLALELDAILAWLVAGHAEWKARGLDEPSAVSEATAAYRAESDAPGRFLDERCVLGHGTAGSSELFSAWQKWCADEGEDAGTHTAFAKILQDRGLDKYMSTGRVRWRGIGLAAQEDDGR